MASFWLPEPMTSGAQSGRRKRSSQQKKTDKVDELVQRYGRIRYPSHVLRDILKSQEESDLLLSAVRRQISLVKCRSQDFEDNQVTIYDKALLVLSKEDPAGLAVLELYLTEFLGIVPIAQIPHSREIVASHIELQKALAKAAPGEQTQRETHGRSSKEHHGRDENYNSDLKSNNNDPPQLNNRVEKILDVYRRAKEEYYNTKQRDGVANLSAVRFLRDTAENALSYLRTNELFDRNAIPELERVFAIARDKATELSGGRKRHFDDDSDKRGGKRTRRTIDSYRPQI